jgi:aminoglycoside phosphotransferase family enzyme/dephospho-CoA kinase
VTEDTEKSSFISALLNPACYAHEVENLQLIETHISWVILTGTYAYKIKKPVDFGFLAFSTLEKRRYYCQEELRLNRRLAPDLYIAVVPVTGTKEKPLMDGNGDAYEYAVKMLQFSQDKQLDHLLDRNALEAKHIDQIAQLLADFHEDNEVATGDLAYGDPDHVLHPVEENFRQIRENITQPELLESLENLQTWSQTQFTKLQPLFEQRKKNGFIRECHGDMHLRNMVLQAGKALIFDCIEFNPNLRWIDVMNEIAFFVMDMNNRKCDQMAWQFLNRYLEHTGDYEGVPVLPFYLLYRAMVLAKVHAIRSGQSSLTPSQKQLEQEEFNNYLALGIQYIQPKTPQLMITYGMPASGKSSIARKLSESLGAIHVRSDVERKRMFGLSPEKSSAAELNQGIYSADATKQTYQRLHALAGQILDAGFSVIVDATFSDFEYRELFHALADNRSVSFVILSLVAPIETLRQRILQRKNDASDADLAVLNGKARSWKPLSDEEERYAITIDTANPFDLSALAGQIKDSSIDQLSVLRTRS